MLLRGYAFSLIQLLSESQLLYIVTLFKLKLCKKKT